MDNIYDVIIIGAGSIGVPTALNMALQKQKVLVIDGESAPGQQNNKKANSEFVPRIVIMEKSCLQALH
jgi:sarcosine oxidase subunit beta